ncbi:ester cyclase [Scytonema hofmannii FACHB-248]|uniref:Ester cyclase n=2 Tax=Cyanophyceae TaxID=3028117 RepID=A0ABR8GVL0_9CYAN|nr:ester cyclase [Scytonema hofmannii FACHB-248]
MGFSHIMEQTLEQNKTFIRNHFEEIVNRKNSAIAYQNFAPDFIDHEEPFVGLVSPELVKQRMEKAYVKYPDLHVIVEDTIAEGDKVMVRCLWRGTDSSTGKKMEFKGFVLWRLANGKIAERWATIAPPLR